MKRVIRNSVISISILGVLCYLVMNSIYAQEPVVVNENSGKEYRTGLRLFKSGKHNQALTHFEKAYQLDERNMLKSVFKDENAISIYDEDHSLNEDRWITIGMDLKTRTLVVIHTFVTIDNDNCNIRIISVRKATKNEQKVYEEG